MWRQVLLKDPDILTLPHSCSTSGRVDAPSLTLLEGVWGGGGETTTWGHHDCLSGGWAGVGEVGAGRMGGGGQEADVAA